MQSIWGSSPSKSLKLNINTSASMNEVSYSSKVTQELNSFNPQLSLSLKAPVTNPENPDKRANEHELESNEFEQVVKKQKNNTGNAEIVVRQDQEKSIVKMEQQDELDKPYAKNIAVPANFRIPIANGGLPQRLRVPVPVSNGFIKPKVGSLIPQHRPVPHFQRNMLRRPMNPQALNLRRMHPSMRPMCPSFNKGMNGMMPKPRLTPFNMAHQMVQMELARLGASSQNVKAFYQDLQMLQTLREESQILKDAQSKVMTNEGAQQAPESLPKVAPVVSQNVEKPSQRKLSVDPESEIAKSSSTVTLGSSFFSFQSAKIIQQEAQNLMVQQEKVKNSPSPTNASSTIKINFTSNNLEISKDIQEESQNTLASPQEKMVPEQDNAMNIEKLAQVQSAIDYEMRTIQDSIQEKIEEIAA